MRLPELANRRQVSQFLSQQAVQLKPLSVAIQHPQQRRIDKPVSRIAPFRFAKAGDLCRQREPETLGEQIAIA
jgi:hypothetical protein